MHEDNEVAAAILALPRRELHSMDTAEGIAEWWLRRQQVRVTVPALTRVLGRLTDNGLFEAFGTGVHRGYRRKA